jgi:hypothetical protein
MRLFRSEEEVEEWCASEGAERGGVIGVRALMALAREWYGGRLEGDWRPRSRDGSQAVLAAHGLIGPFWELP